MGVMGFGRKLFGRKGLVEPQLQSVETKIGSGGHNFGSSPFERHFEEAERLARGTPYPASGCSKALGYLSPEERGELLADMADRPGLYDGHIKNKPSEEMIAYYTLQAIWQTDIAVCKEHLGALLTLLIGNKSFRERTYYEKPFDTLLRLINSAIKQGGYLTSGDCEALAQMAAEIRNARSSYRKADTKKMIARAERLEKLAGVSVSGTEFLMQRCEGADNPFALQPGQRPNAQFWADLLAETTIALEEIRQDTKASGNPAWKRDASAFETAWPAVGDVVPQFGMWKEVEKPFGYLSQYNGFKSGFAEPDAYRQLPAMIEIAQAHSRYIWKSDQIPGLEVFADLENPAWTALVEHLITQRRATKATAAWQKEALKLCQPLGLETVEEQLHNWLTLFHTPPLNRVSFKDACNGARFTNAIDRLEESHPDWPIRHASEVRALGRAVAMVVASEQRHSLCVVFQSKLIRTDDNVYKNTRVTDGVLGLPEWHYKLDNDRYGSSTLASGLRVSLENEEFLRGAVWLVALMPDRARAISALASIAQTAATCLSTGDDNLRSKIVANAAVATLLAMRGSDIDQPVLRLSKVIDNCTVNPPLFKHLNCEG